MGTVTYDFTGETVIVTGASSGIGREAAFQFGKAGATVLNADIQEQPKDKDADQPTHEQIRDEGGIAEFVATDVTDHDALGTAIEAAREYGGVDVMVNNAGLYVGGPMLETTPAEFERIHAVNAGGVFFGTQLAATDMIERGVDGAIVNTASISSTVAQFNQVQYDSTKGAIQMITRGSALELAEHGIRVNAVAPGQIATEFLEGWTDEAINGAKSNELLKPVPLKRAGRPEDVASAMLFLASDAASYVTGELLYVDGGWQII